MEWDRVFSSLKLGLCSIEFWNGSVQYHVGEGHSVLGHHQGNIKGRLMGGFIPTGEGSTGISCLGKEGERRGERRENEEKKEGGDERKRRMKGEGVALLDI